MSLSAPIGMDKVRTQSANGPPVQEFVEVAVLPPRLPPNMASPTGLGPADTFAWDESVNWVHNNKIDQPQPEKTGMKKLWQKTGVSTQRQKAFDTPPFIKRKVPYDTWRKHYAKDKDGRYMGTGTPAEDCLLLPEDVEKWRLGPAETNADKWTRGKAALPVYDDAQHPDELPQYSKEDEAPDTAERAKSNASTISQPDRKQSTFTADGKTAEQIIREAREKAEAQKKDKKAGWKNTMKRAGEFAMLGAGNS